MLSGGEASIDTLFLNTSKANRKKRRNPSVFDAINPPTPWSERDFELDKDLAAMGIEIQGTTCPSHLRGQRIDDNYLPPASTAQPAQTNFFHAEEALIEKALRRLPRTKYDEDDNIFGLAELIGGMKLRSKILDTFDKDVLAATAEHDTEGKDVRDHREKDIELAQAWHPVMQNNMEGFFEEYPTVNSKAWKQRKQREKMAIARAAKEKKAAALVEGDRKAAQSEEPLVSTEPVPEPTEPLEETVTPADPHISW
ncbi:hypothetical protein UCRNP2_746 [Neofusicoccum parvum UCRNP2]|uniref:Uncharacterized protein n=1 Tax=Botryosphaeria parva (strain UCR-NP2) TaxID=1287680 RepID=R1H215_BOTPV|nr:hypothetical protein UCRNP2_746 [Neofusicoccum parvum UCRNP2]